LEENSFLSDFNIHEELFGDAHKSMKSHYIHGEALVGTKRRKVTQVSNSPSIRSTYGGVTSTTGTAGEAYALRPYSNVRTPSEIEPYNSEIGGGDYHLNIDAMIKSKGDQN
jgi:hypothetical protein